MSTCARLEIAGPIATLTLDRPQVNALSADFCAQIEAALEKIHQAPGIACLIVQSDQPRAFCAGGDLHEYLAHGPEGMVDVARRYREMFVGLRNLDCLTIAVIEGPAVGGGGELALGCDFRVGSPGATFRFSEIDLSAFPASGGTQSLRERLGYAAGLDLLASGRTVEADEAMRLGLLDVVGEDARGAAVRLAGRYADKDPAALGALKRCMLAGARGGDILGFAQEDLELASIVAQPGFWSAVKARLGR